MHGKPPPHQETLTSLYLSRFSSEWTEIWHDDLLDGEGQAYHIKIFLAAASCLYTLLCQSVCLSYKSQLFLIGVFTKTSSLIVRHRILRGKTFISKRSFDVGSFVSYCSLKQHVWLFMLKMTMIFLQI